MEHKRNFKKQKMWWSSTDRNEIDRLGIREEAIKIMETGNSNKYSENKKIQQRK